MNISGLLGFGWIPIAYAIVLGLGTYYATGWVGWMMYGCFTIIMLYMGFRYKNYCREPWRRAHYRGMRAYADLAVGELDLAKQENRNFDIVNPCRALAQALLSSEQADGFITGDLLADAGRKTYYLELAINHQQVFLKNEKPEKYAIVMEGIRKDIDASELGPDIVIAKAIERLHGSEEAARYLLALLLGKVK